MMLKVDFVHSDHQLTFVVQYFKVVFTAAYIVTKNMVQAI